MAANAQNNAFIFGRRKNPALKEPEISKAELEKIKKNVAKFSAIKKI